MKTSILKLSALLLLMLLVCCQSTDHSDETEDQTEHEATSQKEDLYVMPGLNHGILQSPINILSDQAEDDTKHNVTLNFSGEINMVENLGHTIQLDFEPGSTITIDDDTYTFKQLHFHTPSEHLIDGVTYPMEMHIVNIKLDEEGNELAEYLVLAILFKMGKENEFISHFIDLIPEGDHETKEISLNVIDQSQLIKKGAESLFEEYYHYMGSLTTHPYTETVFWLVHKEIIEASPAQISRINELEGDNARHIQAIYDREVTTD